MLTTVLKNTDLTVSRACFGTMTFGAQTPAPLAARMVDYLLDHGVNFLDTANVYNHGESERILGQILTGRRDRVVLASKVRGKMGDGPLDSGLSRAAIRKGIEDSLQRLGTDYLDVYYFHLPDSATPVEESLEEMDRLVREGKVRYAATSNYAAWQLVSILASCEKNGWAKPWISQPMYNLIARGVEQEFMPMARKFGISTVVYNPLAGGLLTGKQPREAPLPGTRFDGNTMYLDRYWHPALHAAVDELKLIASAAGRSLISLSLNWLLHHTATDVVILGASKMEQLEENLNALNDGSLDEEAVTDCDGVWARLRGPLPVYNR